jgi:toxin YoeB
VNVLWTALAWDEYLHWHGRDRDALTKINALIRDIQRSPFRGIGKPEPLKGRLAGFWSRRITGEHRLVYRVVGTGSDQRVEIVQCRFHY